MRAQDYLTVAQAAARRGVSRQTIYSAIYSGRLVADSVLGKHALRPADVDALVIYPRSQERKGVAMPGGRGRPGGVSSETPRAVSRRRRAS
jgi:excisionase family DNA binding protein